MSDIFIDTSFLLALAFKRDSLNQRALSWQKMLRGPFITTEFVLLEVADGACERGIRKAAERIIHFVRTETAITVLSLERKWLELGYQLFCQRNDKDWGWTDCISFEVMREMEIKDALTYDHHFEQAGFRALLRQDPPSN